MYNDIIVFIFKNALKSYASYKRINFIEQKNINYGNLHVAYCNYTDVCSYKNSIKKKVTSVIDS